MSYPGYACLCQYRFAGLPLIKALMSPEACPLPPSLFPRSFRTPISSSVICPKDLLFHLPKLASRESSSLLQYISRDPYTWWAMPHGRIYHLRKAILKGQASSLSSETWLTMTFLVSHIPQSRQPLPWVWRWLAPAAIQLWLHAKY